MNTSPAGEPRSRAGRWIAILLPLLILLALVRVLLRPESATGPAAATSAPPELRLAPAASAEKVTAEVTERGRELNRSILAAAAAGREEKLPAPMPAIPPPPAPGDPRIALAHRGAPLTEIHHAALARLRWAVPGKHIEWRGAATKPVVTYLQGRRLEPAADKAAPGHTLEETTALNFLRHRADVFGAGDDAWRLVKSHADELGYTQVRFAQYWRGLEVWPGAMTVQTAPNGDVTLVTAAYAPEPQLDPRPRVSEAEARVAAARGHGTASGPGELLVHAPLESAARLAWKVIVSSPPIFRHEVFVDARDGSVIERVPLVVTAAATGNGTDLNGQNRPINLWLHTDTFHYMIDTSKGMYDPTSAPPNLANSRGVIAILDQQNATQPNVAAAVHLKSVPANGPWDADAVSASVNLGKVYDYYLQRFNRNSVNGTGGSMTGVVNLNDANAYADFQTQTMTFGNQDKYAEALDVVAHEMTHSVISTTSQLVYRFQSGALNESFADVLGEGCEAHFNGGNNDWLMGTALAEQLRSLQDPGSKFAFPGQPYPEKMSQFFNLNANTDAGGVHINSSITNHAFYQLAAGLPGAIGLDHALQIFFRCVTTKLNANSQFIDARLGCVQSAVELYGAGSNQALKTAAAFDFVEIFDQAPTPDPTPTPTVNAADSTLFIFPNSGFTWLGRRETAFGDDSAGVFLGDGGFGTLAMPFKKPAVRGDGAFAVFVTPTADGSFINTETGVDTPFGLPGQIDSAAMSADGVVQAYVLRSGGNPTNQIYVFDDATDQTTTYTVHQPLTDQSGGATAATVLFVDALDLSPDGRFVFYDALNRLTFPGGGTVDSWSISFIDREAGTLQNLIAPIPGVNMGNPAFAQTRPELLTFDVSDTNGVFYVYAANLATGSIQPVMTLGLAGTPGWPGYTGEDAAIVYTNYFWNGFQYIPYLERQAVQTDGVTANGSATVWLSGSNPSLGPIYRRGTWQGPAELTVTAPDPAASETAGNPGQFQVARSGSTTEAVNFSLVITGTATQGGDFSTIPLTASIAAGQANVAIPVTVVDDPAFESAETVVLTLAEGLGYTLGTAISATVTVADNDPLTFASWAAGHQIGATDYEIDTDLDGTRNLIEYAFGWNPRGPNPANGIRLVIEADHGVLEVTRTHRPTDITVTGQVSGDLSGAGWLSGTPHTSVLTDTTTSLRVRDSANVSAGGKRFMRVNVTKP